MAYNVNYKYIIWQQKLNSIQSTVIICFILTPFLRYLPNPFYLPLYKNLQPQMNPKDLASLSVIESIDSNLISVCLINDYWLIADLHLFVHIER